MIDWLINCHFQTDTASAMFDIQDAPAPWFQPERAWIILHSLPPSVINVSQLVPLQVQLICFIGPVCGRSSKSTLQRMQDMTPIQTWWRRLDRCERFIIQHTYTRQYRLWSLFLSLSSFSLFCYICAIRDALPPPLLCPSLTDVIADASRNEQQDHHSVPRQIQVDFEETVGQSSASSWPDQRTEAVRTETQGYLLPRREVRSGNCPWRRCWSLTSSPSMRSRLGQCVFSAAESWERRARTRSLAKSFWSEIRHQ